MPLLVGAPVANLQDAARARPKDPPAGSGHVLMTAPGRASVLQMIRRSRFPRKYGEGENFDLPARPYDREVAEFLLLALEATRCWTRRCWNHCMTSWSGQRSSNRGSVRGCRDVEARVAIQRFRRADAG